MTARNKGIFAQKGMITCFGMRFIHLRQPPNWELEYWFLVKIRILWLQLILALWERLDLFNLDKGEEKIIHLYRVLHLVLKISFTNKLQQIGVVTLFVFVYVFTSFPGLFRKVWRLIMRIINICSSLRENHKNKWHLTNWPFFTNNINDNQFHNW